MLFPLVRESLSLAGSDQPDRTHSINPSVHDSSFQHVYGGRVLASILRVLKFLPELHTDSHFG
jgi:hypothetical protein